MSKMEENVADPSEVNKELSDYIEVRESKEAAQTCTGKKITQVGPKQRGRQLRLLKDKFQCTCALWFSERCGLKLSQVKLNDYKRAHTYLHGKMKALKHYKQKITTL